MMQLLSKRIPTILGLLLLIGAIVLGIWYLGTKKPVITEGERPKTVRVTNVADNKFSVSWITTDATIGTIEWGVVGEKLTTQAYDDRDSAASQQEYVTHHVTVSELQPDTQYAFRILSGKGKNRFDNNGSPYTTQTGPSIAATPVADSFYGQVETEAGQPSGGSLVYVSVPSGAPVSVLTKSSGGYSVSLTTIRTTDLAQYVTYDPKATIVSLTILDGKRESTATVSTANAAPVPTIVIGKTHNFLTEQPPIAQVEEGESVGETPTVFNVEPLGDVPGGSGQVILLNPTEDGEEVATTKPEFFGIGPAQTVISITVHSVTPHSDTIVVDSHGEWAWTPPADLEPGEHTLTIAYIDLAGIEQVISRTFFVQPAFAQGTAFEATPSGSTTPTPTPTATATAIPRPSSSSAVSASSSATPVASPREGIPSTESGVPVSGVMTPTVLTALIGFAIMVVGALLLVL